MHLGAIPLINKGLRIFNSQGLPGIIRSFFDISWREKTELWGLCQKQEIDNARELRLDSDLNCWASKYARAFRICFDQVSYAFVLSSGGRVATTPEPSGQKYIHMVKACLAVVWPIPGGNFKQSCWQMAGFLCWFILYPQAKRITPRLSLIWLGFESSMHCLREHRDRTLVQQPNLNHRPYRSENAIGFFRYLESPNSDSEGDLLRHYFVRAAIPITW
jgi:hypothetical protein